ncbi:MAG TPA: VWA domain-containing protein [Vicinamibacterales bacterium]|nr:VWA domain-containing protein [Vicinamibacterales bacterium]
MNVERARITRMQTWICALSAAGLLVAGGGLDAQQPTFRSGTNVVEVTVIVRDAKGNFVSDLTIDDFEVTEDGRPQQVQTVYVVRALRAGAAGSLLPSAPGDVVATGSAARVFVFAFDLEHITPGSLTRARQAVERFASERLAPNDLAGVVSVGGTGQSGIDTDRAALISSVKRVSARADVLSRTAALRVWPRIANEVEALRIASEAASARNEALQRAVERACSAEESGGGCDTIGPRGATEGGRQYVESEIHRKAVAFARESRTAALRSIGTLEQIANGLEAVPGRKTLVWISEGTFSDEIAERARNVAFRASRSGVTIYALDPRGLGRQSGGGTGAHDIDDTNARVLLGVEDDVPDFLAVGTGGLAVRNENNMLRALQRIEEDTSTYYVLGYAAPPSGERDEFRRIRVTVKRKGLNVRARHGYVAQRPATMRAAAAATGAPAAAAAPVDLRAAIPTLPRDTSMLGALDLHAVLPATVTAGRTVEGGAPAATGVMRMRPDAAARVRELAGGAEPAGGSAGGDPAGEGWAAYQRGDVEAAIGPLEEAARNPDARPWVLYALGLSQAALGRPADAVASWERVRAAAPAFAPVYIDLAATYSHMSDLARALGVLRDAQTRWPRDPEIRNAIGVIYVRRGAVDNAIDAFTEAVRVAPDDALGYFNLGRAYEMRYARGGRFVSSQGRWVMPDADRDRAIEYYREYVRRGGPYVNDARDALLRLQWMDR